MYCDKVVNDNKKMRKSLILWGFVLITLIVTSAAGANAAAGNVDLKRGVVAGEHRYVQVVRENPEILVLQ